jgi:hypothetical protein
VAKEQPDRDYLGMLRGEIVWNSHTKQWEKRRFVESLPWWKLGVAHLDDPPDSPNGLRCHSRMQPHAARAQDKTPHEDPHHIVGTTERVRLLDRMNTWKAFVSVLALCLIINGFLFYFAESRRISDYLPVLRDKAEALEAELAEVGQLIKDEQTARQTARLDLFFEGCHTKSEVSERTNGRA